MINNMEWNFYLLAVLCILLVILFWRSKTRRKKIVEIKIPAELGKIKEGEELHIKFSDQEHDKSIKSRP